MKLILGLFALLFILGFAIVTFQKDNFSIKSPFLKSATATINNKTFNIEVAVKPEDQEIGLSNKNSLAKEAGMLFIFKEADFLSFWMRNMKFPIDIIFIKNDRIVTIHQNVQPPKSNNENLQIYKPDEPADKVLEINAGLSKGYNFKKGDIVKLENL